jgi:hypothetical protein
MMHDENTRLLGGRVEGYGNSERDRNVRSASVGAMGGSSSLGNFRVAQQPQINGLPKSYSVSADGSASYLTPSQLGRQELYSQIPFMSVFGMQRLERTTSEAFANYAAGVDIATQKGYLSEEDKSRRASQASMVILDEIDFDAHVVTTPLVFAISKF